MTCFGAREGHERSDLKKDEYLDDDRLVKSGSSSHDERARCRMTLPEFLQGQPGFYHRTKDLPGTDC
jgi:hypothetical protein